MSLQSFYFPNLFYISNMQECWSHFLLSHNHVINPLQIICESCFLESKLPICTASKCGQKLYCYEFVCFGNTDVRWVVQYLFLVEIMIGVVADGGHGLLVCFSGLLFLPNLPAPAKVPGYLTSSLLGPTLWMSWEDSEAALYAWISRFLLRSPTPLPACSLG